MKRILLIAVSVLNIMGIGATGFEPAASRPPAVRSTKLSHAPNAIPIVPNKTKIAIKIYNKNLIFKKAAAGA